MAAQKASTKLRKPGAGGFVLAALLTIPLTSRPDRACEGSSKWVHRRCLERWQAEVFDTRARVCQVCRTPFSLQPTGIRPSILRTAQRPPPHRGASWGRAGRLLSEGCTA